MTMLGIDNAQDHSGSIVLFPKNYWMLLNVAAHIQNTEHFSDYDVF